MTTEPWSEPSWTVDQVRKLGQRIRSLVRTNRLASTASTILMSVLMLEIVIFMYTIFFPAFTGSEPISFMPDWFYGLLFFTFMLSIVVYVVAGSINQRLNGLVQVYRKVGVIVKLSCAKCGRLSERTWTKDDYIFKEEGNCACGGPKYISQMYMMPLQLKGALPESAPL